MNVGEQQIGRAGSTTGAKGSDARRQVWLMVMALVALTLGVFGRTGGFGFVSLDDNENVFENAEVTSGLTLHGIERAFTHGSAANWDPLTTLSHLVDCQIYGLHAGGHHLTNVLLHTASVILLFLVLRQMTGAFWRSALVAAVFAVHPLRVESVAWVSERKDTLSGLLFMLTLGAYVRYTRRPGRGAYWLVVLLFVLGLMSKAMLVTLPFVLLLLDWWPLNRWGPAPTSGRCAETNSGWNKLPGLQRLLLEKLPLLALSLGSCIVAAMAQSHAKAISSLERYPFSLRLGNALHSVFVYVWQMFKPTGLAVFYPYPAHPPPVWEWVLLSAVLVAASFGAWWWRQRHPYLLAGWLWYLGMLMPVIGVVQLGAQAHADRYTYLPQIGLYVALIWLVAGVGTRGPDRRVAQGVLAAAIIAALAAGAFVQTGYWRDSETLWRRALAVTSDNDMAEYNLGMILIQQGHPEPGAGHLERAVEIQPAFGDAHNNLGSVYLQEGRSNEALAEFQKAVRLEPDDAMVRYNLGIACMQTGRTNEALAELATSVALKPDDASAQDALGKLLFQGGQVDEAVAHLQRALALQPDLGSAQTDLGWVAWTLATSPEASRRNGARAVPLAEEVVRLSGGGNSGFVFTLAAAEAEAGRFEEAAATAGRAQALALQQGNAAMARFLENQSARFRAGQPYRDDHSGSANAGH